MRRRQLALALLALAALAPLTVWSLFVEPGGLLLTTTTIVLPRWPRELDALRVLALADIHAGAPHVRIDKLRRVVATANAEPPDLVVLLGDDVIHGVAGGRLIPPEAKAPNCSRRRASATIRRRAAC